MTPQMKGNGHIHDEVDDGSNHRWESIQLQSEQAYGWDRCSVKHDRYGRGQRRPGKVRGVRTVEIFCTTWKIDVSPIISTKVPAQVLSTEGTWKYRQPTY